MPTKHRASGVRTPSRPLAGSGAGLGRPPPAGVACRAPRAPGCQQAALLRSVHAEDVAWLQHAACPQPPPPPRPDWTQTGERPGPHPALWSPAVHLAPRFSQSSSASTSDHTLSFRYLPLLRPGFADWRCHPGVVPIVTCGPAAVRALWEGRVEAAVGVPAPPGPAPSGLVAASGPPGYFLPRGSQALSCEF